LNLHPILQHLVLRGPLVLWRAKGISF
jgi:hypothetical protein